MGEMEPHRRTPARELFLGILLVFIVGAAIILAAWAMRLHTRELALRGPASPPTRSQIQPPTRAPAPLRPGAAVETKTPLDDSAAEHVGRLIEMEHDRNIAAIATARLRLDEDFRRYSARVPQFIEALNTLPEKARLARTLIEDKSQTSNETQAEAAKLFAENVVPPEKLRSDVAAVVAAFQRDVEANRNLVLASGAPAIDLPSAPIAANMDLLLADFSGQLARFLGSQAEQVPTSSVSSLAKSVVVEEAMRRKVTETMEAHDSNSKRAAVVGTAVGVLAAAADYWLMQSRFESALTSRCQGALDKIQAALWADPQNGLEVSFTRYVDLVREAQLLALKRAPGK
ncbi:MAG: hypothetical protein ABSA67_12120 [Candidatus Brocadiia bacterium]|jgi:hypothetical protein